MARLVVIGLRRLHGFHWLLAGALERASPIFVKKWRSDHNPMKREHVVGRETVGLVVIGHHGLELLRRCGVRPRDFRKSVYVAAADPMCLARNLRGCEGFDTAVTCQAENLKKYRLRVPKVIGSYLCAEHTIFKLYPDEVVEYDVGMMATFRKRDGKKQLSPYYLKREKWLKRLERDGFKVLAKQGVFLEKHARALCRCKIGVQFSNRGFRGFQHFPPAMRVFETMATGRMLICDRFDLNGLDLVNGKHYATFPAGDYEVFREKVKYYLRHEEEREQIAVTGRQWVLKGHTYHRRAEVILKEFGLAAKRVQGR